MLAASRYYGTVFAVLLFVLVCIASVASLVHGCYTHITLPNHRIHELQKIKQARAQAASNTANPLAAPLNPSVGAADEEHGAGTSAAGGSTGGSGRHNRSNNGTVNGSGVMAKVKGLFAGDKKTASQQD